MTIGSRMRKRAARRRHQQRAHLVAQQRRTIERDADGAPAERRILLPLPARIGQHLVAAEIERAEHDRLVARRIDDCCDRTPT